jgi:outer membrane protein assembly factor BamB
LDEAERKAHTRYIEKRIMQGRNALTLEDLEKLTAIADNVLPNQKALDAWLVEQGFKTRERRFVMAVIPKTLDSARDVFACLDANDGRTLWTVETEFGEARAWGSSSTPAVVDGLVYVAGDKTIYCLDANDGKKLWKQDLPGKEISSSPLVVDGLVVIQAGPLHAFDAKSGEMIWKVNELSGTNSSPSLWEHEGKKYILSNGGRIGLVDPAEGALLWAVPGGGSGTVAVDGDVIVLLGGRKEIGLVAHRISPEKADKLWSIEMADRGSTPILFEGHAYVLGNNKLMCVKLADGSIMWETRQTTEITSPILADGKIFAPTTQGKKFIVVRATPEKFELLGETPAAMSHVSSPVIQDGVLYMRLRDGVAAYDLR